MELDSLDLYFENTTPPHRKFYRLTLEPSLFYVRLRRQWGRMGTRGRQKEDLYDTWPEAIRAFRSLTRRRLRHGYRTCSPPCQVGTVGPSGNGPQNLCIRPRACENGSRQHLFVPAAAVWNEVHGIPSLRPNDQRALV